MTTEMVAVQDPAHYFEVELRDQYGYITLRALRVYATTSALASARAMSLVNRWKPANSSAEVDEIDNERYYEFPDWQRWEGVR